MKEKSAKKYLLSADCIICQSPEEHEIKIVFLVFRSYLIFPKDSKKDYMFSWGEKTIYIVIDAKYK